MDGIRNGSEGKGSRPCSRRDKSRLRIRIMGETGCLLFVASLLFFTFSSGCGNKFFDPTQVGRFRPVPAVNVILDSLGVAEETPVAWEQAEEPMPIDTLAVESDYVFRAGDVISVVIFELLQEGVQFVNNYVVTETGRISIPEVGIIEVAGLSETQLEEKIKQILSPGILKNPSVIVTLAGSQQRMFSILGDGVPLPGRYSIPRYNFRLTDALATAGSPRQFNVSYIYVSRFVGANKETGHEPLKPGFDGLELEAIEPGTAMPSRNMQQTSPPRVHNQWPESKVVIASSEMATDDDWESAGMPKAFEWPSNRRPGRMGIQTEWESSSKEPIGVNDILNTLEERSRREQIWLSGQIDVEDAMESFRELAHSEKRTDERISRRDTMSFTPTPATPERMDEQVSVKDILKTLDERARNQQKWLGGEVDVENAKESLRELNLSKKRANQRINRRESLVSSAPTAPKLINKPLDLKESGRINWNFKDGEWIPVQSGSQALPPTPTPTQTPTPMQEKKQPGHVEWKFKNGNWVPVQVGTPASPKPTEPVRPVIKIESGETPTGPYEMPGVKRGPGGGTRLIMIPVDRLLAGDSRYNIVIKPGDTIHVPVNIVGEFCIMGHVNRPGYINTTGRSMTLKMAIAAAGGLGPLAWPKRVEVVRRIGREHEEIVMVDLDKIASGEQPDIFIKPNDLINVGTHATSRWRAILRNAFRATYGFGFVYDRNFADRDFGSHRPFPGWF
ncbi:MAG: polysaccharide biosynthesis/export family protein [Planctomycetes bacterium]|nr:polysaccharide biosynthesis/export family protein [Planctomycetota bacterium]